MFTDSNIVLDFINLDKKIKEFFSCDSDLFIKPLTNHEWTIHMVDDFFFLSYWGNDNKRTEAVIIKKNGEPLIYNKENFTMIVAIDCIKIGFLFANDKKIS